jgi:hypothetical protein
MVQAAVFLLARKQGRDFGIGIEAKVDVAMQHT